MRRLAKLLGFAIGIGAVTWLVRERVLAPAPVDTSPTPSFRTGPHPHDTASQDSRTGDTGSPSAGPEGLDTDGPATGEAADDDGPTEASESGHPHDDLTVIVGIGPTYRDRLAAAGITTFAELGAADPAHVAEHVGAGAGVVAEWVEQARERTT